MLIFGTRISSYPESCPAPEDPNLKSQEWKRAIRKAAKRINRDPETPITKRLPSSELASIAAELEDVENIPPMCSAPR